MPVSIALLRGVNVGGKNKVPMAALRALFESLGHTNVQTLIQSGNVIFTAPKAVAATSLEKAIASEFGFDVSVVLRTRADLSRVLATQPFAKTDTAQVHVGFMAAAPSAAVVKAIDAERFAPEEFAVRGKEVYYLLPGGMGTAKLPAYLDRQLKVPTTVRNWNTVTKLEQLARGAHA
jgi:uncharacterized protein (DUF1697 family)